MATKIGFDAKLAGTGVDWLIVGKDVASTLKSQEETREANRKAGAQAVADEIKALSATEMGKDAQANQWMADGIDAITETALIDKRLWLKGALSTKDFMRNKTNRANGTNIVLQAYKKYNEDYGAIMEGVQSGELAGKTLQARAQIERLFDFGKTGMYINPLDSEVNVAEKELGEDGMYRMSKNPDKLLNASRLLQGATAKYYRFKAEEEAAALAKGVATTILRTVGGTNIEQAYLAIDGLPPAEQKKLNSARKKQVQAMLTDDKAGSFLNDYLVEEGYSFTNDIEEAKKNDKLILMNQDGSNNFSENSPHGKAQMEYAVQEFDKLLEVYLPKKKQAPLAPKPSGLTATERTAQKEGEIGYGLALDLTSGGAAAGESLQKIKANNNSIGNVYETDTSYVIQYKDGSEDKIIEKIMRDGVEAREETAVSLMAAVNPNYDATKAETAKQRYLKSNKIGERTEKGLFGERTAISSENSNTYQTKSELAKGDKGVSISEQIEKLPKPDEDNSNQVLDVIKDIYPLPGTESYINQIQVTGVGTGIQDVLNFKLPPEFIPFVQDLSGVTMGEGNNIQIDYDATKDKATLRSVIDGIIAGMYDVYNKSDARKKTEDKADAVSPEAVIPTGTTTTVDYSNK